MAEQFEYRDYQIAFEIQKRADGDLAEWHSTIYVRKDENAKIESASVSPPDKSAAEARDRAIRVAKSVVDTRIDGE